MLLLPLFLLLLSSHLKMSGNVEDVVQIIGSYITLIVFAFVLVVFRVYVKLRVVRNFGPEDYVCIFALVSFGFVCPDVSEGSAHR